MSNARITASLCVAALAFTVLGGCTSRTVTQDTPCSEFMKLSESQRNDAVIRIASELGNPDVTTPLGRPNVEYVCAQAPKMTLGRVIEASRMTPKATPTPTPTPTEEPTESTAPTTSNEPEDQWALVHQLPQGIVGLLDETVLAVKSDGSHNSLTLLGAWGDDEITVDEEVPEDEFVTSSAVLVTDGATVTVMATFAWKSEAEGVQKPVCHSVVREYSFPLSRLWEKEVSAVKQNPNDSCGPSTLSTTTDGRGVIVQPENVWISVSSKKVHPGGRGTLTAAGPMIGGFDGVEWGELPAKMTVFDPVSEKKFTVADSPPQDQNEPTPGQLYRQLANRDQRPGSWLDDHTVVLGEAMHSRSRKQPVSRFDVRSARYTVLFRVGDYANGNVPKITVDPQSGTVLVSEDSSGSDDPVRAFSLSGKKIWSLEAGSVCAAGGGHAVVGVNDQLATLDATTGKQLNYTATEDCSGDVVGSYLLREGDGNTEVIRILP